MNRTVLIIENDHGIKEIVSLILQTEGYEVKTAGYATAAEVPLENAGLILLDEWINKKEGHMLCKEIKAIEAMQSVPVIIFSTSFDIADIAKNCDASGFIGKPFEVEDLLAIVKRFLPLSAIAQAI
jgi:DNA-binding response OmpR family regulator